MRRTKIICTVGPSCADISVIERMIVSGMDLARLNFSFGSHEDHARYAKAIRSASSRQSKHVGIIQDLQGPRIRVGPIGREVVLRPGVQVTVGPPGSEVDLPLTPPDAFIGVQTGDRIMVNGGLVELVVRDVQDVAVCEVVSGGRVCPRMGVNLPDTELDLPALTEKDRDDLKAGMKMGVDLIALSFVNSGEDVRCLRSYLEDMDYDAWIIAKIERKSALARLSDILREAEGVMIARGDLGVELPLEEVPYSQKLIIKAAHSVSRFAITATQMLESMVEKARPTRAEVSDVANAILDGSDALMLSEETAKGRHPVEAVRMMAAIAERVESTMADNLDFHPSDSESVKAAISHASCVLAKNLGARAIVAFTSSGTTARRISRYRHRVPVLGLTPSMNVARKCTVLWGVMPHVVRRVSTTEEMISTVEETLKSEGLLSSGDLAIIVAGLPIDEPGTTNMLKAHVVR